MHDSSCVDRRAPLTRAQTKKTNSEALERLLTLPRRGHGSFGSSHPKRPQTLDEDSHCVDQRLHRCRGSRCDCWGAVASARVRHRSMSGQCPNSWRLARLTVGDGQARRIPKEHGRAPSAPPRRPLNRSQNRGRLPRICQLSLRSGGCSYEPGRGNQG
jgi:hypothetical protein